MGLHTDGWGRESVEKVDTRPIKRRARFELHRYAPPWRMEVQTSEKSMWDTVSTLRCALSVDWGDGVYVEAPSALLTPG